jgi:hypothetical protein
MADEYNSYVRFKTGGYQLVEGYETFEYVDQDVYSGYFRDDGWILLQLPEYTVIEYPPSSGTDVALIATVTPATGTAAIPDPQADVDPRKLTWKETALIFKLASTAEIARFWVRDIIGFSDSPPNEA